MHFSRDTSQTNATPWHRHFVAMRGGLILLLLNQFPALASPGAETPSRAMRDDASLSAVCFVDAQHGWAVGDRGAIWQTSDGGRLWQPQESGVDCRLTAVQFIDPQHGWAAGGVTEPFTQVSRGLLLRTRDGGQTWNVMTQQLMGAILRLKFVDSRRGWALCVPNGLCGGGVLTTDDGGQDWTPIPQQTLQPWSCGDIIDPARGAVATDGGLAAASQRGEFQPSRYEAGLRRPAILRLAQDGQGILAGEGGLLLTTRDSGARWQPPGGALPAVAADINFRAVALSGDNVWIAGSPGAVVLRSADRGATWDVSPTGTTMPIEALTFVDATHGWAVGAWGQILATADGGRTWQAQRVAGRRAAYLAVFAETDDVPLELLARLSAGEGYRGAVSLLSRRDLEAPLQPPLISRVRQREGLLLAGAGEISAAWQFPMRQPGITRSSGDIVEDWRRAAGDGEPLAQLEAYLIREIRCWRPEIVVTHGANARGEEPLRQFIHQGVLLAVKRAADENLRGNPARIPLPPWRVKRIVASLGSQQRGTISLSGSQILPQLGRSLAEYTGSARGVISGNPEPAFDGAAFSVAWDESPIGEGYRDFFSGLNLRSPSDARRALPPEAAASLDQLRRIAQRRQTLQAIVSHQTKSANNRAAWLAQIGTLTRDLDDASAAMLLYQLACSYRGSGQCDLAAETFTQLVEKYPAQTDLATASSLWLLQYYASGEVTVRADRAGRMPVQLARAEQGVESTDISQRSTASLIPTTGDDAPRALSPKETKPSNRESKAEPGVGSAAARGQLAGEWLHRLETISDQVAAEPRAVLPASRALASAGDDGKSQRLVLGLMRSRPLDAWWSCAAGENWLHGERVRRGEAPKSVWRCRRTTQKPRLDGRLEDACWRGPKGDAEFPGVELRSVLGDDAAWPAVVQLAYDHDFLYVAVTCRQAPGTEYAAPSGPRQRDADISAHDRISLMLDVDRDWTSYWRLSVDHRGQTADDCWGDSTWNPQWFVATSKQSTSWTCEAAIPWSELASKAPQPGDTWAVGVERVVPGVGFQSWTTPAAAATVRPEGFGFLIFE